MNYEKFVGEMVERYGLQQQDIVCIEELSELQKELTKSLRGQERRQNLIEELAHCYISMDIVRRIRNISMGEIEKELNKKVEKYYK